MAAGSRRSPNYQVSWFMDRPAKKPWLVLRRLHCVFLLSELRMGKRPRLSRKSFQLQQHEPMGICQGSQSVGCVIANRLDD